MEPQVEDGAQGISDAGQSIDDTEHGPDAIQTSWGGQQVLDQQHADEKQGSDPIEGSCSVKQADVQDRPDAEQMEQNADENGSMNTETGRD